jgi:flagellar hook-associated protein 3 FlgL
MRVTSNTYPNYLVSQLGNLESSQTRLQTEVSTGLSVQEPENNPDAMRQVLDLTAQSQADTQYQSNITQLQQTAAASSSAMQSLQTIVSKAGEIATMANGVQSPQQLASYGAQVTQLIQQAAQLANTQSQGSYLFAGTNSSQAPFKLATDSTGNVTGVTYQGNQSVAQTDVAPGVSVSAQTVGENNTGTGPGGLFADSRAGADLFGHLIALQNDLNQGNTAAIASTDDTNVQKDESNLAYQIGANGALQSRLQASASSASSQVLALNGAVSQDAGADLAQTMLQLTQTQNAYQAALQTGGQAMNISLLTYLH